MHTYIHAIHTCLHTCIHTHVYIHACTRMYLDTCMHTKCIQTCIHVYIHMHTYHQNCRGNLSDDKLTTPCITTTLKNVASTRTPPTSKGTRSDKIPGRHPPIERWSLIVYLTEPQPTTSVGSLRQLAWYICSMVNQCHGNLTGSGGAVRDIMSCVRSSDGGGVCL